MLEGRRDQIVLDSLIRAMSDNNLDVVVHALRSFVGMVGEYPAQSEEGMAIPEPKKINDWWAERRASIVAQDTSGLRLCKITEIT